MDCLPEYDGVKVEFKIPEFELYNIDLQRIGNEATYRGMIQLLSYTPEGLCADLSHQINSKSRWCRCNMLTGMIS